MAPRSDLPPPGPFGGRTLVASPTPFVRSVQALGWPAKMEGWYANFKRFKYIGDGGASGADGRHAEQRGELGKLCWAE
jgi:hypothetical protein